MADEKLKVSLFRNSFLNLAVPSLMMSEPGESVKNKIKEGLTVDEWDRWELKISETTTLGSIVGTLEKKFKLQTRDVIYEATPIFFYALRDPKLTMQKQPPMKQPLLKLLEEIVSTENFTQIA